MSELRSFGLQSLLMGDIAGDGGMGTGLASVGQVLRGTAVLESDDPEISEIFSEQQDDAIESITTPGKRALRFGLINIAPLSLKKVFGGNVTGTGTANETWHAPAAQQEVYQSVKATTLNNVIVSIPRAKIIPKFGWNFTRNEVAQIDVEAVILVPTKSGVAPIMVERDAT